MPASLCALISPPSRVCVSSQVWAGNPARKLRDLRPQERDYLRNLPQRYVEQGAAHQEVMNLLKMKQEEFSS